MGWPDAPKALPLTPPGGLSAVRTPVVRTGPVPRILAAVPDPEPDLDLATDAHPGPGGDRAADGGTAIPCDGHGDAGYTQAWCTDAGHTDAGYTDARHTDAGHTDAGYTEARRGRTGRDGEGRPIVVMEALPGQVGPGGSTEFLVMAANPGPEPLDGTWLGLRLPSGVEVSSVVPPAGTVAVTSRSDDGEVIRARLPELAPGACVGLAVDVHLAERSGAYLLTAFLAPCDRTELTLTCEHVVEVAAAG